jgi:hypothetical protein
MAGGAPLSTLPHSLLHGAPATPITRQRYVRLSNFAGVSRALFVMRADELIAPINVHKVRLPSGAVLIFTLLSWRTGDESMRKPVAVILFLMLAPISALAQSGGGSGSGGGTAGGSSAAVSPSAGSGSAGTSGTSIGPGSAGGTNNAGNDPSAVNAARGGNPATPGTNALGTSNSSGSSAGRNGTGRGAADGTSLTGPSVKGDVALEKENKMLDRKVKSICKGC